jgi:extracellular elastinolytic metalloproteinase
MINPLTYGDIDPVQVSSHPNVPKNPALVFNNPNSVHSIGEVWALFLWELTHLMWEEEGSAAFENSLHLVTQALHWTPPEPNFVSGRDGLLLADLYVFEGRYTCKIWRAAAKRGIGWDAQSHFQLYSPRVVESFEVPVSCQ